MLEIPRARIDRTILLATDDRDAADLFLQAHPRVKNAWDGCRDRSRPLRKLLKAWFGWNLTDVV